MTSEHFERWFESGFLNKVRKGDTILMDRARFHRGKQLEKICGKAQVHLLFLPAYSPDFNPIEKDSANMKRVLRDTAPLCDLLQTAVYNYWR
jgi:transposase